MSECKRKKLYSVIQKKNWDSKKTKNVAFSRFNEEFGYVTDKDINWILTQAVKQDSSIIKYFSKTKIKIGTDDQAGRTAIHAAVDEYTSNRRQCRNKNALEDINLLLDIYDETNYRNKNGFSHFHAACMVGNVNAVQKFIDGGVDVNLRCCYDGKPTTPLHLAIELKEIKVAKLLLKNGADPNARGEHGMTPLNCLCNDFIYYASTNKIDEVTFESNCKFYSSDEADEKCNKFLKLIQLLISYKSDINAKDCHGNSVLFKFFHEKNYKHFFHKRVLEILFQNNVDVTNVDQYGCTILHLAITRNCVRMKRAVEGCGHWYEDEVIAYVIEQSLKLGANVNACDYNGNTPLNVAVSYCDYKAVKLLLEHNADVHTVNFRGGFLEPTNKILRNLETTQNILDIIKLLKSKGFQMNGSHELLVLQFLIGFDHVSDEYNLSTVLEFGSFNTIQNCMASYLKKHKSKERRRELHDMICCYLDALRFGKMLVEKKMYVYLKKLVKQLDAVIPQSLLGYVESYCPEDVESSVRKARKIKIDECATLLDLCTSSPEKTYVFLKNSNYKKVVNAKEFARKHDFLAGVIKGYITKSLIRQYFKRVSVTFLQLLTSNKLPVVCCDEIISYLDNNDLLLVCELVMNEI